MWNAPLPVYAMAHRLAPNRITLVSPGDGAAGEAAEHVVAILRSEGFDVAYRPVASGVDLVAESATLPALRKVLDKAIRHRTEVTVDYTGGSKLMAAYARWLLGDRPTRAVYLDASTSDAVFDDGTRLPYAGGNLPLDHIARLHRTALKDWRRIDAQTPLDRDRQRGDALLKRLAHLTSGTRAYTTSDILGFVDRAAEGRPNDLHAAIGRFANGTALLLDLEIKQLGDWLERWVAARVREAVPDADVYLNVEGQLEVPAHTRLLGLLRRSADQRDVDGDVLEAASSEAVGSARKASGAKFEVDVVAVVGYGVSALSCYSGTEASMFAWKAREISARAAQLGGSVTRPVFVAPLESEVREKLAADLQPAWDKLTGTTVVGLSELLRTVYGDKRPLLEAIRGPARPTPPAAAGWEPLPPGIDLVATIGGSPLPTHQAIETHDARNVLLLHSPDTRSVAHRLAEVHRTSGRTVTLRAVDPFDGHSSAEAIRGVEATAALDLTGGTKPMASHALLTHVAHNDGALSRATYVDGLKGVLRQLDGGARRLPGSLQPAHVMQLYGWRLTGQSKPSQLRGDDLSMLAQRVRDEDRRVRAQIVAAVATLMAAQVPGSIVRTNLTLRRADDGAPPDPAPDVVATVNGVLCALFVAWGPDDAPQRRVWQALATGRQLGGDYTRTALVARVKPVTARAAEAATVARLGGNPQVRVFSPDELAAIIDGATEPLARWARGGR
jgi:hypothetical protein